MAFKFFFTSIFFLFILNNLYSQINASKELNESNLTEWQEYIFSEQPANKRLKLAVDLLRKYAEINEYPKAVKLGLNLLEAFKDDKDKYEYLLNNIRNYSAFMLTIIPNPDDFDIYDKFILDNKQNYQSITAIKKIASYYANKQKWDSAIFVWKSYIKILPKYEYEINKTIALLKQESQGLKINPIGLNINTSGDEWDPNPSSDGKYLYYSASHRIGGKGSTDIWVAEFEAGNWSNPKNLNANINSPNNETIDNISLDGNKLLLSGNFAGTYGNFDIYMLEKDESGWGQLRHLPRPINSKYTDEAANLSADQQTLIFTSDRPNGVGDFREFNSQIFNGSLMGNIDIYVSEKVNGEWSDPINLGEVINTPFAERSAYLHPDGKTLYFSSDGHYGLGGLDVYKTTRLSDTSWTQWSEPVNLGKDINSVLDDWGYKISLGGDSAFFAAYNRTIGKGGWDLYSISLPDNAKPNKIVTIKGRLIDSEGNPLFAKIIWEDIREKKLIGELNSNPKTGEFLIALPKGKFYGYYAEKETYYPSSAFLDLTNQINDSIINITITLLNNNDLQNGNKLIINNLFFEYDSYNIEKESYPELERLVKYLNNNDINIQVIGHTDSIGSKEYNIKLSENRAKSIVNYLIKNGIEKSRLNPIGKGYTEPVNDNSTPENRSLNRRVEIKAK